MTKSDIWQAIDQELRASKRKFPRWPDHPAGQAGVVVQEAGALMKACMSRKYSRSIVLDDQQKNLMKIEAIQTAAAAIRFLENL